jgi:hypothetical protein
VCTLLSSPLPGQRHLARATHDTTLSNTRSHVTLSNARHHSVEHLLPLYPTHTHTHTHTATLSNTCNNAASHRYGRVNVTVNEGRDLAARDPYVKLYLSVDGSNVKSTKKKTRVQKKSKSPVFQEKFEYELTDKTPLESTRLQITVW